MNKQLSLPESFKKSLSLYKLIDVINGRLGDEIIRYEDKDHNNVYLKFGEGVSAESLNQEAVALSRLANKNLIIPNVIDYSQKDGRTYLLISGVSGLPAHKIKNKDRSEVLRLVATALHKFHQVNIEDSKALDSLDKDLEKIRHHLDLKVINKEKFTAANKGKTPERIIEYLALNKDKFNRKSLTHGDFCLPNVLIENEHFGFIDLGDCGPGDRYKDFSSMEVSITRNFGAEWIETFYQHYDPDLIVNREKIRYYQLIDQFGYHLDIEKYKNLTKY